MTPLRFTPLRRADGTFDLDGLVPLLRHLIDEVPEPEKVAYVCHEHFADRGVVLPHQELLDAYSGFFSDRAAALAQLEAPLEPLHVRAVVICEDGIRFIQIFRLPLATGGTC